MPREQKKKERRVNQNKCVQNINLELYTYVHNVLNKIKLSLLFNNTAAATIRNCKLKI